MAFGKGRVSLFFFVLLLILFFLSTPAFSERYKTIVFNNADARKDINYGSNNQLLDLYTPKGDTETNRPAIIFIHGGSFMFGSKEGLASDAILFARMGYVTASINYRLCPSNTGVTYGNLAQHRNCLNMAREDSEASIKWMVDNSATYGVDPRNVFVVGSSAGALTSLYLGELPLSPTSPLPRGVGSCMGAMILADVPNAISNGPPAVFFHGSEDTTVPIAAAKQTRSGLANKGTKTEFNELPGVGHSVQPGMSSVSSKLADFFFRNLDTSPPETTTTTTIPETTTTTIPTTTTSSSPTTSSSVATTSLQTSIPQSTTTAQATSTIQCSCSPFSNASSCGDGACPEGFILQTRSCTPSGCATNRTCTYYQSCDTAPTTTSFPFQINSSTTSIPATTVPPQSSTTSVLGNVTGTSSVAPECQCTPFANRSCAGGSCPLGYVLMERNCTPAGCAIERSCAYSVNCPLSNVSKPPPAQNRSNISSSVPSSTTITSIQATTTLPPELNGTTVTSPPSSIPQKTVPSSISSRTTLPAFSTDPISSEKENVQSTISQQNSTAETPPPFLSEKQMAIGASAVGAVVAVSLLVALFLSKT